MKNAVTKNEDALLPADPMVSMIERIAMDPDADLEKLERMLEMKKTHEADVAKASFAAAFSKASAAFPKIPLRGKGHNGKRYATLEDITALTRPVLSENGLVLSISIDVGQNVVVTAELMHKDGHTKSTSIELPRDNSGSKNAVQSVGSTQTYGQRYTAQAILGLSLGDDTDDDGNSFQTVGPDEFIELRDLVEATGTDMKKFLTAYAVQSLEQFPADKFNHAKAALRKKQNATKN